MGRPAFAPTAAMRKRVAIAAGGGMSHEEIALGLGLARNTLEKYFERELSIGAYEKRLEVLQAMQQAAKRGNVAAQKAYMQLTPRAAAPPLPMPEKSKPEGKKAQAQADAQTAHVGTDWDTLLKAPVAVQ
jgi:hypothetical protein